MKNRKQKTENRKPKKRSRLWWGVGGILGILTLLLLLFSWLLTTDLFWQWAGPKIVEAVNDRVNGTVTVQRVSGNPVTGLIFDRVAVTRPQYGETLRADRVKISLSLLSFVKLQPVINGIEINTPRLSLIQDPKGQWNITGHLKERPPPPFKSLRFPAIVINQGEVRLTRPGQKLEVNQIDLKLDDLTIKNPSRPHQVIQIQEGYLAFNLPDRPRIALQTSLSLSNRQLQLKSLNIALEGQPSASIAGTIDNLNKLPQFNLAVRLLPLTGKQASALWSKWPVELGLAGELQLTGDARHPRLTGKAQVGECQLYLTGAVNRENSAKFDYRIDLRFESLSARVLKVVGRSRLPADSKLTPLSGTLTLTGGGVPGAGGRVKSNLTIGPFQYNQAQVEAAQVNLDIDPEAKQQVKMEVKGNFGGLTLKSAGRLIPGLGPTEGLKGEVGIQIEQLNPALLVGPIAPPGRVGGKFTGRFTWTDVQNLSQARVRGTLTARGTLGNQVFQELGIQAGWEQNVLQLQKGKLRMGGLRADLQGSVRGREADLKFRLKLSRTAPWPFLPAGLRGQVQARGTLKGPLTAPRLQLTARGRAISWDRFSLKSFQVSGDSNGYPLDTAHLKFTAATLKTPGITLSQVKLTGQARQRRISFDLRGTQPQGPKSLLTGVLDLQTRPYQLNLDRCRLGIGKHQVNSMAPIQVQFRPGGFEIAPVTLRYRKCTINLGGRADLRALALRLAVERFPVKVLQAFWPAGPALQGPLNLKTAITGSLRKPMITGKLSLSPGRLANFRFQKFQSHWTYADGRLQVKGRLEEKSGGPGLVLKGQLPLHLSFRPLTVQARENGLHIKLNGEKTNLALLSALTPTLSAAAGDLEVQAQCTGSLKHPRITGKVRWGAGFLKFRLAGLPYNLAPGELRLEENKLSLPGLVLHSGEGRASLTGAVTLAGIQPRKVDFRLQTKDFLALKRAGSRALVDGQVTLTGAWPKLEVKGRLVVPKAALRLSLFRSEGNKEIKVIGPQRLSSSQAQPQKASADSTLWKKLRINVDVDLPGEVWVRRKDLKAELRGGIKICKLPPKPLFLGGKIQALQGAIILNRKPFKIEHAWVTFPGSPEGLILLDARARHEMKDITLIIVASGPIANPQTKLESMPPLPQSDLLSYLLFDRPAAKLTREQAAMGILGGITAEKMKDIFGGAVPLVSSLTVNGSGDSVGVGKKITKDITVSYERNLNPINGEDVNQFRVDYKINKYLSFETQFGRRNPGGDVFLNLDF